MNRAKPSPAKAHRLHEFALRVLAAHGPLSEDEELQVLRGLTQTITTQPAGVELLAEGEPLTAPALLLEGWAIRQRVLPGGRRQIFSFVLPGDPIGLCDRVDGVALVSTMALTDVTLAAMPVLAEAVWRRMGALNAWGRAMLGLQERDLYDQVVRLGLLPAQERLAQLLLDFHHRLTWAGLCHGNRMTLPFTHQVLSGALGLSTVHTGRLLKSLRADGLIETHGQDIELPDVARLTALCGYRPFFQPREAI